MSQESNATSTSNNQHEQLFLARIRDALYGVEYAGLEMRPDVRLDDSLASVGVYTYDELDIVEFLMAVEDTFGIEIPDEAVWKQDDTGVTKVSTLRDLYNIVFPS